jgi:hypothetical protein
MAQLTVGDLIAKLRTLDPALPVFVFNGVEELDRAQDIELGEWQTDLSPPVFGVRVVPW